MGYLLAGILYHIIAFLYWTFSRNKVAYAAVYHDVEARGDRWFNMMLHMVLPTLTVPLLLWLCFMGMMVYSVIHF